MKISMSPAPKARTYRVVIEEIEGGYIYKNYHWCELLPYLLFPLAFVEGRAL